MKMKSRFWVALAMASIVAPATAQVRRAGSVVNSPAVVEITLPDGTYITPPAAVSVDATGQVLGTAASPLAVGGRRESFQLATANAAAAPVTLYGGTYVLSQSCTGYGTVTLRYRGADGITMVTMVSKTAADASGGSLLSFAGGAIVDVSLAGTTGCFATLARMP